MIQKGKQAFVVFALGLALIACGNAQETDAPYDDETQGEEPAVETDNSGLHTTPPIDCVPPSPTAPSATVTLITTVINDNGGTATPANFVTTLRHTVGGYTVIDRSAVGTSSPGQAFTLAPNTYTVNTDAKTGYAFTIGGDCATNGSVAVKDGDKKTCVIIANDIPPPPPPPASGTLKVITVVVNDNGGTYVPQNFGVHVKLSGTYISGSPSSGASSPGTSHVVAPGTYTVNASYPTGVYTVSIGGDCTSTGLVTIVSGATKTCTLTLDDVAPAMSIRCTAIAATAIAPANLTVTITGPVQKGIFAPVAMPDSIQYGANAPSNYWSIPYPTSDTTRARRTWTTDAGPYVFTLPSDTNGINFFVTSKAGGVGQWFNLNGDSPWTVLGDCVMSNTLIVRK